MAIDYNRPFAWSPRQWTKLIDFEQSVAGTDMGWADRVVIHHTYIPTEATWKGMLTMNAMKRHYLAAENGTWDSAPHLYIVLGSPQPAWDGIWQGTPLTRPGIHAGRCNRDGVGFEVVGNFDDKPWGPELEELVLGAAGIVMRKRRLQVHRDTVMGHRECLANKSCPGRAINMDEVRFKLAGRMAAAALRSPTGFTVDERFRGAWQSSGGVWRGQGMLAPGFAKSDVYQRGSHYYQDFERGVARLLPDGRVEWLLLSELGGHSEA